MQLWTDKTFTQFALSFNSQIIVKTDENVSYTNMIDETSYVAGYEINRAKMSFLQFEVLYRGRTS